MPMLTIGGTTIKVARTGAEHEETPVGGELTRQFDGSMRDTTRDTKWQYRVTTALLTTAERNTHLTALRATPPVTADGDIVPDAPEPSIVRILSVQPVKTTSGLRWEITFQLHEV